MCVIRGRPVYLSVLAHSVLSTVLVTMHCFHPHLASSLLPACAQSTTESQRHQHLRVAYTAPTQQRLLAGWLHTACKPALTTTVSDDSPTATRLALLSHEQRTRLAAACSAAACCTSRLVCVWRSCRCRAAAVLAQQDGSEQVMLSAVLGTHLQHTTHAQDRRPQQQARSGRAEKTKSVTCGACSTTCFTSSSAATTAASL